MLEGERSTLEPQEETAVYEIERTVQASGMDDRYEIGGLSRGKLSVQAVSRRPPTRRQV
jgi:hypothetical protein